jgi:nitroreductase
MRVITLTVEMNTVINQPTIELPKELLQIGDGHDTRRRLDPRSLSTLFQEARTYSAWIDEPVDRALIEEIYDHMRWAPTAANASPLRVTFVQSAEAKARLIAAVNPGNVEKIRTAPVTAILAYDTKFFEHLDRLAPHIAKPTRFETDEALAKRSAESNSWLQAGYFILAARSLGLDCGPIGGFDQSKVNQEFFSDGRNRSFLLVNLGYGKPDALRPRAARLDFDDACAII